MPRHDRARPSAYDEFERVGELDDFETALTKIVRKDKVSADILRRVAKRLPEIVNEHFDPSTGNVVPLLADQLGLTPARVRRLYKEFVQEDEWRMMALLMAARHGALTKEHMREAFNHKPAAEELKERLASIYLAIQNFIKEGHVEEFIRRTSTPLDPSSPITGAPKGDFRND